MRLNLFEQKIIKQTANEFDAKAKVFLYGSRADDTQKGGDIDLLIFSEKLLQENASEIRNRLCELLGEQKIDIVIVKDNSEPFTRLALKKSVLL